MFIWLGGISDWKGMFFGGFGFIKNKEFCLLFRWGSCWGR